MNTWPIVYGCHQTGALHIELAASYSADCFLLCFSAFCAVRGHPAFVYTDRGTQLRKASSAISSAEAGLDWSRIAEATAVSGTSTVSV